MKYTRPRKAFNYLFSSLCCLYCVNVAYAKPVTEKIEKNTVVTSNAIAGGSYLNTLFNTRPLLATTSDGGTTWTYPPTIITQLPSAIASLGAFTGARCSKLNCLASGYYTRLISGNPPLAYPLLANSGDAGATWTYSSNVLTTLPSDFHSGTFSTLPWCSGNNCIVAGNYLSSTTQPETQFPLIAHSNDGGSTWNYPATVVSNLPPDFSAEGFFFNNTCVRQDCVAVGQYQSTPLKKFIPLLANSHDGGATWTYPDTIRTNLPSDFDQAGVFNFASCNLTSCVAVGTYSTNIVNLPHRPLIAVTHDGGSTWTYPQSVFTNLPRDFVSVTELNYVSCNANRCVAVGQYESNRGSNLHFPLLLTSQDNGDTWTYSLNIINNLPADYRVAAGFNAVTCNRNICIAVGSYKSANFNGEFMPLLASSTDGGQIWTYPPSIIDNATTLSFNIINGTFSSVSCNDNDCVAEGQYQSKRSGGFYYPLIAVSHDGGKFWTYPPTAYSNLPADYSDKGTFAGGYSSHTLRKNKL